MKHSIQTVACFTTFAISTGAQNFLESTKSEKFSEVTNYNIIPTKPAKSDIKKNLAHQIKQPNLKATKS